MVTIFTIPKAFKGHIDVIQRNAIQSWIHLRPPCEIILCGDDQGTDELAGAYGIQHISDIEKNDFGTPLLSSAFQKVRAIAQNDLMCYINSDIILFNDFTSSLNRINANRYLLLGNRWNVDITTPINFDDYNWEMTIKNCVRESGQIQSPVGVDYFIFNKHEELVDIPPFAVGRPMWDNWFIYNARKKRYMVIDASRAICAVHQNHNYNHLKSEYCKKDASAVWNNYGGPEIEMQRQIMNGDDIYFFKILDATHVLTEKGLKRALDYRHLRRRFSMLPVFYPKSEWMIRYVENILRRIKKNGDTSCEVGN